ncbi:MAG: hypothetical protein CSA65_02740 [Proteobacteria bacterium]|nr:MAG: hypothetical protein CSA65_02740 [Pseudomonadota bacterium]
MTKPRRIIKGKTYMLTRRCTQRSLFLKPSPAVNQLILYCLALAAERKGVFVHAFMVLGNHYHLIVTDPDRQVPDFMHDMNMLIAARLNAHYGRSENFWKVGSYSAVELIERNDILAKIVYALQNPVAAGLVSTYEQWPGAFSRPKEMLGSERVIERPKAFFSERSSLPEVVTLTFYPPPNVGCEERFVADVEGVLAAVEAQHRERMFSSGGRFLGRRGVLAQRHTDQPQSEEEESDINPRVACGDKWKRIETLRGLQAFYEAHEQARLRLKAGETPVEFPEGTYRRRGRARLAG